MRRVVSLFLPTWPCDRVRRKNAGAPPRDRPMVTVMQEGNRRIIAAADEAARMIKLHSGMTLAHAHSLVPDLHVVEAAPQEDEAALEQLGLWCTRY